ncbi:MAG TPA: rRNA pseudouridine synthase [Clostridiaceae bacterium]|nr:rRNA pseudouridine synthase [Clostridiaceae bacterium]
MGEIRLQKYLAMAGVASRRHAEKMILNGEVEVNGAVVKELGTKVNLWDEVRVKGKIVSFKTNYIYIMLNKPTGYITSVKDQFGRKTVLDLLKGVKERVYPVGRLDYDTSGLLLLTNDGDLTYKLTHPKHEIKKVYIAEVKGKIECHDIDSFQRGIVIDGILTSPASMDIIEIKKNSSVVKIAISEGRNRQIRKMCNEIGHPVIALKRIAMGPLQIGNIPEGSWRYLTSKEIDSLKKIKI